MRIRTGIFGAGAIGLFVAIVQGCATEAVVIDETEDSGSVEPVVDSGKKDSSTAKDSSTTTDSSTKPDAAKPDATVTDSSVDAADAAVGPKPGDPFDPLAPKEGAACPPGVNINDTIDRRCGFCGTQRALCEAGAGGAKVVGAYGACTGEKTGAGVCLPGERKINACGFCGTQVQNCDNTCAYITGLCQNEVVNGCTANEVTYIEGVCATATDVRKQTCSAACAKGSPEPCAPRPIDEITVSQTAGTTVTGNFQTTGSLKVPLLSGACPATESSTVSSLYHWVRVKNTGAQEVTVTLSNGVPVGGSRPAVTFTGYAGSTIPTDRKACTLPPATTSPEKITFAIPANSAIMINTQLDTSTATQAKLALEVKTNFIGAEVPAAPDHILTIGPNAGDTVTQNIQFVATQTLDRPNTLSPYTCPRTFSGTQTAYRYIRLVNNTATAKTVDVSGDDPVDTVIAAYPGPDTPISTQRANCVGVINDFCPAAANIATADSCLTGVNVPANGSTIIYIAEYFADDFDANVVRVTTK